MSDSLNQCNFIGRLGADPETRYMPTGDAVVNFRIACSEQWKDKSSGEKQERTEWVSIVAFGKLAEICAEYLRKGSQVFVSGRFRTEKYTDKDGVERYATKITADKMQMLGGKSAQSEQHREPGQPASTGVRFDDLEGDIPF